MARATYVFRDGKLIPKHKAKPLPLAGSPMVISDSLPDTFNPVDGKRYSSKAAYYRAVRAAGCEIMGNEAPRTAPPPRELGGIEQDIQRSYEILRSR